jgi:hypothetical protein
LTFPVTELYVPPLTSQLHCSEAALQFAENTTSIFVCRANKSIVRENSKMNYGFRWCFGTLMHPYNRFSWRRDFYSTSTNTLNSLSARKEAASSMRLYENSNYGNLFSSSKCHIISKALLIFKKTYYFWNLFHVMHQPHTLKCSTNFHLVSFFLQYVSKLFLKSASQTVCS